MKISFIPSLPRPHSTPPNSSVYISLHAICYPDINIKDGDFAGDEK